MEQNKLNLFLAFGGKLLGSIALYEKMPREEREKKAVAILDNLLKDFYYLEGIAEKTVKDGIEQEKQQSNLVHIKTESI